MCKFAFVLASCVLRDIEDAASISHFSVSDKLGGRPGVVCVVLELTHAVSTTAAAVSGAATYGVITRPGRRRRANVQFMEINDRAPAG